MLDKRIESICEIIVNLALDLNADVSRGENVLMPHFFVPTSEERIYSTREILYRYLEVPDINLMLHDTADYDQYNLTLTSISVENAGYDHIDLENYRSEYVETHNRIDLYMSNLLSDHTDEHIDHYSSGNSKSELKSFWFLKNYFLLLKTHLEDDSDVFYAEIILKTNLQKKGEI